MKEQAVIVRVALVAEMPPPFPVALNKLLPLVIINPISATVPETPLNSITFLDATPSSVHLLIKSTHWIVTATVTHNELQVEALHVPEKVVPVNKLMEMPALELANAVARDEVGIVVIHCEARV